MSGLMRLGKQVLRVSGSSIQRCKDKADFFGCISGRTSDASRLARAAHEHAVEIRSISLTPYYLYSLRLEKLGQIIKDVLGQRSIIWSDNSTTFGCTGRSMYVHYSIQNGYVVMCLGVHKGDFNELVDTLKHEGWHAVQQQC